MKKAIKKLWVNALRSGAYKQTKNALARRYGPKEQRYCCLGVLCSLYMEQKGGKFEKASGGTNGALDFPNNDAGGALLPSKVQKWAGLIDVDPEVQDDSGNNTTLANLNDTRRWKFAQIADVIEEQL